MITFSAYCNFSVQELRKKLLERIRSILTIFVLPEIDIGNLGNIVMNPPKVYYLYSNLSGITMLEI